MNPRLFEVTNPDGGTPLRKFSDPVIQAQIDGVIARMKPDSHVAAVAHVDGAYASVSLVYRTGSHLTVMAGAYKPYGGKIGAEADIVWEA